MAGALIVAHRRSPCLFQPYDQATQVGGIAPSNLDRFAKSGDARYPPINRLDINIEMERQIDSSGAARDETFGCLAVFRFVGRRLARAATGRFRIHLSKNPLVSRAGKPPLRPQYRQPREMVIFATAPRLRFKDNCMFL